MITLLLTLAMHAHGGCHADHGKLVCCVLDQHGEETCVVVEGDDEAEGG